MDGSEAMITVTANAKSNALIRDAMLRASCDVACVFEDVDTGQCDVVVSSGLKEKVFSLPVRVGQLIDYILQENTLTHSDHVVSIQFKGAILDVVHGMFRRDGQDDLYLTEKEVDILRFLHAQKGQDVTREALLGSVWNYVQDVETHTLETHIYRLRQKIELNPAEPQILVTCESGYSLIFEDRSAP